MMSRALLSMSALVLSGMLTSSVSAQPTPPVTNFTGSVGSGGRAMYTQVFEHNAAVRVHLAGTGDGELDLYVLDMRGRVLARDTKPGDQAFASFVALVAGPYRIVVLNRESTANAFTLTVVRAQPLVLSGILEEGTSVTVPHDALMGQSIEVALAGGGLTNLNLYVIDGAGRTIAKHELAGDAALLRFVAPSTGGYQIVVTNLGTVANTFTLTIR